MFTTAHFVYVRLHGPEGKCNGNYSDDVLADWSQKCLAWKKSVKDVFFYFDNDINGMLHLTL